MNDWHKADILAALHRRGLSIRELCRQHGYASNALGTALYRRWPKGQLLIAEAIGVPPEQI